MNQKLSNEMKLTAPVIRDFLTYMKVVGGKSQLTVQEYYTDLRTFFRYIKLQRGLADETMEFDAISINDIDIKLIKSITISDVYEFMNFCIDARENHAATRARKSSSLRVFFKYLTNKVNLLENNPMELLETPKTKKSLPKYLSLDESLQLLDAIDGSNRQRDYCIITLFLNCGMRLSELCNINIRDIHNDNTLRITGKGNKERVVYLNEACIASIKDYLEVRPKDGVIDKDALFLSNRKKRISNKTVQHIVYTALDKAGLGGRGLSTHKLRHTAATLMYQYGNVDIRVIKDLLGHENLNTTEIYTHLSDRQLQNAAESNPLHNIKRKKDTKQKSADN